MVKGGSAVTQHVLNRQACQIITGDRIFTSSLGYKVHHTALKTFSEFLNCLSVYNFGTKKLRLSHRIIHKPGGPRN
jgi:hypothetical protein